MPERADSIRDSRDSLYEAGRLGDAQGAFNNRHAHFRCRRGWHCWNRHYHIKAQAHRNLLRLLPLLRKWLSEVL